ncbi:mRNA-decapping enzyme subunit 2 [Scaptodrosophila lebanonensis]|uniref:m7GpppN-mRNA hydrolase n=1 Tax=Drosophila lebanonensis TaxID=7225 RepID=A0A6J2TAK4_DROLE|nr:mRNA-decapping enzyme subunit 2 [Scaptodrosophila lebanonensis]
MEIAPLINTVATAAVAATASSIRYQPPQSQQRSHVGTNSSLHPNDNVNNLALLASLTLQKALNINNSNNPGSDSVGTYQQVGTTTTIKSTAAINQQQQRRHSDNEDENDVLNKLLKTGAVFSKTTKNNNTTTTTFAAATSLSSASSAPIAIEKRKNNGNSTQKQRLNSSISSTNSTISTNSSSANSYGSAMANGFGTDTTASGEDPTTTTTTKPASSIKLPEKSKIPSDILDDLASRFIINVPDMELNNLIRICFQIELAHWFYLDFFCAPASEEAEKGAQSMAVQRKLPVVGIKQFAMQLFQHIPFLNKHFGTIHQILEEWKNYKLSVPTYGAILVSEDLNFCLLVQSYFARNSWGFPKGKINEHEDPAHCATREVYEETGYDITDIIDANDYIEAFINYQYTRLYIVRNIPLNTQFAPRTRNEIKCCDWFRIDALPIKKNDAISQAKLGKNANSFFMIIPFVKRLKKWVNDRRAGGFEPQRRHKCSGQQSPKTGSPTFNNTNNINNNKKEAVNHQPLQQSRASRRQRHKSMGDLDGIKLNNLNNKSAVAATTTAAVITPKAININNKRNNNHNNNKQLNVAAGSNITNQQQHQQQAKLPPNNAPLTPATTSAILTTKRQLFQSQSQNDAQPPAGNEKMVCSFDLIRKEKQQQMKAAAKAQKQQLQQQQQRMRAKSQSDKQSNQQQQQQDRSSMSKMDNVQQQKQQQQQKPKTPTTGVDLIAMLTAAAAAQTAPALDQQQQRPRPASVSLNLGQTARTPSTSNGLVVNPDTLHKLQRMASGSNLRILKRPQPMPQQALNQQQQQHQLPQQLQLQRQASAAGAADLTTTFTPNFNSWTNFSFTKNFIANVFC